MITIQLASVDDISAIRNVQLETWLATYPNKTYGISRKGIEAKFALGESFIASPAWVAKKQGIVVAYCTAKKELTQNRIMAIYVLPGFQRRGIGGKLMQEACLWLGIDKDIYLNVATYSENAIRFYQSIGFVKTGKSVTDEVARLGVGKVIPEIEMVKSIRINNTF